MQGGVRKRGTTWSYYFDLGKIDGKRKKKEKGGFRTKKEAEQALTAAMNEYNNAGTVFEPTEITVAVRIVVDPVGVGTRCAEPINFPFNSGITRPIALAAPVELGTILTAAARERRRSPFLCGPSRVI